MMLTDDERREIQERCDAATEGPWREGTRNVWQDRLLVCVLQVNHRYRYEAGKRIPHYPDDPGTYQEDCAFAAHARTDLPACLTHMTEQDAVVERLKAELTLANDAWSAAGKIGMEAVRENDRLTADLAAMHQENIGLRETILEFKAPDLAREQPCGCVICTCEVDPEAEDQRCFGCGAKNCDRAFTEDCVLGAQGRPDAVYTDGSTTRAEIAAAKATEREACAQLMEHWRPDCFVTLGSSESSYQGGYRAALADSAAAIRAREQGDSDDG